MAYFLDGSDDARRALLDAVERLADAVSDTRGEPGWSGAPADTLRAAVEALDPIPEDGRALAEVVDEVRVAVLAHAVRPTDRATVAHLHSPTLLAAAATEVAIGAANQSMDSYDQAPAATLVEDRLVRRLAELCGLPAGASGVMTPGGTASNLLGLVLARERAAVRRGFDLAADGLPDAARRWRIVASSTAHFSVARAARLMGFGRDAVVGVEPGPSGAMEPDAIDAALRSVTAAGDEVIAVVGTAGTTDLGAIDPLAHLAQRASEIDAWCHVDAAVAGAFVLSERLVPLVAGIGSADSITVDLHKLWWQPISASALLVADESSFGLIREQSDYLDRDEDVADGVLNLVGRSLDTSRRFDALKALVSLRHVGRRAMAEMLEHLVDLAAATAAMIDADPRFELVAPTSSVMVVFRWVGGDPGTVGLDGINTAIQRRLFESGRAVLGRTRHDGRVALKFTLVNPGLVLDDLRALLELIDAEARTGA